MEICDKLNELEQEARKKIKNNEEEQKVLKEELETIKKDIKKLCEIIKYEEEKKYHVSRNANEIYGYISELKNKYGFEIKLSSELEIII